MTCRVYMLPVTRWAIAAACKLLISASVSGAEHPISPITPHRNPVPLIPSVTSCIIVDAISSLLISLVSAGMN